MTRLLIYCGYEWTSRSISLNNKHGLVVDQGLVAVLPVIVLFAYVQRFLVQGLSSGALKG